jgi:serine/threonine protein phosphatase PrpC
MTMEPAIDLPAVEYAERSDPGRDPSKQVNEDVCGHRETRLGHLCVVCDGMGGHAAGREAAELALATIFETFEHAPEGAAPATVLRAAIEEASRRVFAMPTTEVALGRPGSTVVAVLMHAQGTEVAHVGDSRAYLVHEGQIFRVTRDHSIVQEMVDRGLITLQQAAVHPDANRITRALGMAPEVEADLRLQPLEHVTGDAFVLCSDGLSDLVEDAEILAAVDGVPAAQATGKLVDIANARGGHDNITVLVLRARSAAIAPTGGVAPTVAQTQVTQATALPGLAAGEPAIPMAEPLAERPVDRAPHADRATEVPLAAPLTPTRPPPPTRSPTSPGRVTPALVVGIGLALAAMGAMAAVLVMHFAERGGTHNPSSEPSSLPLVSSSDLVPRAAGVEAGVAPAPTMLVPQPVEVPVQSAAPIAPLEPSPEQPPSLHRKRKPKTDAVE